MTSSRRMFRVLAALLPLGALGISTALSATPAKPVGESLDQAGAKTNIAERLQTIRAAASQVTAEQTGLPPGDPNILKAWWGNWHPGWRNGGWGWRPGWGNGGWGNGGWRNWHNGWRNGGWPNFWGNW